MLTQAIGVVLRYYDRLNYFEKPQTLTNIIFSLILPPYISGIFKTKDMKIVIGEFKDTGINEIDIDLVISKWNHLWMLAEWQRDNSWRIVKYLRKDSGITSIKLTISYQQASEIIKRLDLKPTNSGIGSGYSWRTEKDSEYLDNWRRNK